jgi:hypothetical protein
MDNFLGPLLSYLAENSAIWQQCLKRFFVTKERVSGRREEQGCGSGSGLDPDSIGCLDPDPDSESGSGSGSRGSKKKKMKIKSKPLY